MLLFGNFTDYFGMTVELCLHDGVVQETYLVTFVAKVPTKVKEAYLCSLAKFCHKDLTAKLSEIEK